jgi:hypothetical protein
MYVPPRGVPPVHRIEIERQIQGWKDAGLIIHRGQARLWWFLRRGECGEFSTSEPTHCTVHDRYPLTNIADAFRLRPGWYEVHQVCIVY